MSGDGQADDSLDRLIAFATQLGDATPPSKPPRRRPRMAVIAGTALIAAGLGGIGYSVAGNDSTGSPAAAVAAGATTLSPGTPSAVAPIPSNTADSSTTGAEPTLPSGQPTVPVSTVPVSIVPVSIVPVSTVPVSIVPVSTVPVSTSIVTSTTTASGSTIGVTSAPDPVRWAEYSDGKVYLRGKVPTQAIADQIRAKAAAVVGDANVVVEYQVVAGTPLPKSAPLYVRDSFLFFEGSATLNEKARSVLDLGVILFQQNPQMSVIVKGHTDATGSVDSNLQLAQHRVDAIIEYFVSKGVALDRVSGVALGEADPVADNSTPEGRAKNRRVELEVINLLG